MIAAVSLARRSIPVSVHARVRIDTDRQQWLAPELAPATGARSRPEAALVARPVRTALSACAAGFLRCGASPVFTGVSAFGTTSVREGGCVAVQALTLFLFWQDGRSRCSARRPRTWTAGRRPHLLRLIPREVSQFRPRIGSLPPQPGPEPATPQEVIGLRACGQEEPAMAARPGHRGAQSQCPARKRIPCN